MDDCCLRFTKEYVQKDVGDYVPGRMFYDPHLEEQTNFYLSDTMNEKKMDKIDAKIEYRETFPRTFVEAFDQIMEKNNETRETAAIRLHPAAEGHTEGQKKGLVLAGKVKKVWKLISLYIDKLTLLNYNNYVY